MTTDRPAGTSRSGITHVLSGLPIGQSLRAHTGPGDVVVDANMDQPTAHDAPPAPGAVLVSLDTSEPAHMERSLAAYLRWLTRASERLPRALAYDDALSAWWYLPFTIHHYRLTKLPQIVQQGLWWLDHGRTHHVSRAITGADTLVIWAETTALSELYERFLRATFDDLPPIQHRTLDGTPRRFDHDTLRQRLTALSRPQLGAAAFGLALSRQALTASPIEGRVDVLISTQRSDWMRDDEGRWTHRYLGDTAARLGSHGLRVAWYPNITSRDELPEMVDILGSQPEPTSWLESEPGPARRAAQGARVMRVWRRWSRFRSQLASTDLAMEGVDLTAFVVNQGDGLMPRLGAISGRYERARAAIRRLKPAAVLVRNEFWPVSHPLCAAATRQSPVFAYQHGSIPANHWLYRRAGALVRPPGTTPTAGRMPSPDRMLMYGRWERELMTQTGFPDDAITTIGSLRHDVWLDRARALTDSERARIRRRQGFPERGPGRLVVAVCAQLPHMVNRWMTQLVEGARRAGVEVFIAFRSHWNYPSDSIAREVVESLHHDDGFVVDDGELFDLLAASDVMITGSSTTVVEAAAVGTPVITVASAGARMLGNYTSEGLAPLATDADELGEALQRLQAPGAQEDWEKRRKRYLDAFLVNARRPAADALAELILRG